MSVALDKQLVYELEHRDSRRRKSAVERLGKSDNRVAIKLLLAVSRQDADESLRTLALNMARTKDAQLAEKLIKEKEMADTKTRNAIMREAQQKAKAVTEEAFGFYSMGLKERALTSLGRALVIHPDPRNDAYFMNVVHMITGEEGEAALQMLPKPTKPLIQRLFGK